MSDDGPGDSLFRAPGQLRPNRRMADESLSASANERARERRTVADVNLHISECHSAVPDKDEIGRLKNLRAACAHAIRYRGRKN